MDLKELLAFIENWEPTPEQMEKMYQELKIMEEQFEKEAWDRRITQEWLNRSYSI